MKREDERLRGKKEEEYEKEEVREKKGKGVVEEKDYEEGKGKLLGVVLDEGDIGIGVVESVEEFVEEGEVLDDWVF